VGEEPIAAKEIAEPEKPVSIIHIFAGADVTNYNEFASVIQARVSALGIRQLTLTNSLAPRGLERQGIWSLRRVRRLGPEKLFDALRAASLKIRIEPDAAQLERMRGTDCRALPSKAGKSGAAQ
jgi:hypothetical protein